MKLDEFTRAINLYPLHAYDIQRVADSVSFEVCAFDFAARTQPNTVLSRHATYWDAMHAARQEAQPAIVRDPVSSIEIKFARLRNQELRKSCARSGVNFYNVAMEARTPVTDPDARFKIEYGEDWEVLPR